MHRYTRRSPLKGFIDCRWRKQQHGSKHRLPRDTPLNPSVSFNFRWREQRGSKYDFSLLDRSDGAGWDLAKRLICPRDQYYRGRLSVGQALQHRYFRPEF